MYEVLGQMVALIACGVYWRERQPFGLDVDTVRQSITGLVYTLLLPALVLLVLWRTPLGLDVLRVAVSAAAGLLFALLAAVLVYRALGTAPAMAGALVLAAAFPNVTYLGLPFLENTLGAWARSVAIQYDLFACTPLLLTAGVMLASRYGGGTRENPWLGLLKVPPLWAALLALVLNASGLPMPAAVEKWLGMLAGAVVPLMLIALGMGLRWSAFKLGQLPLMAPALVLQLLLMPLLVWGLAWWLGLRGEMLAAVVLEAAMPSMVLGMVICDRYHLDTTLYITVVTISTAISLVSLPLWYAVLMP